MQAALASSTSLEFLTLRDGLEVPVPALQLLWNLENSGFRLRVGDNSALLVAPHGNLSPVQLAELSSVEAAYHRTGSLL